MSTKDFFLHQMYAFIRSCIDTNDLLRSTTIQNFKKLETDLERVNFAYNFFINDTYIHEACFPKKIIKNNETSSILREQGNEMFRTKKMLKALCLYTESIGYATDDSPALSSAYSNRSALLFVKGYFKECLEDIGRALESNHPLTSREKLQERRQKAILALQSKKSSSYYFPVPVIINKHPKIAAAADCVELNMNEIYGTHVIASRDIKSGEVISVEKPYVSNVCINNKFFHCHHCLDVCFNMIACDKCATTLYCSTECKSEAFQSYHRYECEFGRFEQEKVLSLKTTLLCVMQRGFINLGENQANDEMYLSDRYLEIYRLETKESVIDTFDHFVYCATAGLIYHCLKLRTNFLEENDIEEDLLKEIILRNVLIEHTNTTLIDKVYAGKQGGVTQYELEAVGEGIYSFSARYNHSCAPNCFRSFHGTSYVTRAIGDIKRGEQCSVSYGWCYTKNSRAERNAFLKKHLYFTCNCIACDQNWPTYPEIFAHLLDISGCVNERALNAGFSDETLNWSMCELMDAVASLQTKSDVSDDDRKEVLVKCFKLRDKVVQPSRALACIQNLIFHLLLMPGNVVCF